MPKQISLDLDDEEPTDLTNPPERVQQLIDLMAEAIVAVWQRAQEVDHCRHAELPASPRAIARPTLSVGEVGGHDYVRFRTVTARPLHACSATIT